MPAIQSSYLTNIAAYKAGHVPDMTQADLISRTVETVAGIPFGAAAGRGVDDKGCILYAGAGFLGVVTRDRSVVVGELFSRYESARIVRKGPVCVVASVSVADGDPVYVTPAGLFTNIATSNFAIPNSFWETTTAAAALGVIFIK